MDYNNLVNKIEWNDWEDGSLSVAKVKGRILMASQTGFTIFDAKTLKVENGYQETGSTLKDFKQTAACALVGLLEADAQKQEETKAARPCPKRTHSPYERTKAAVYATGNKWAIENFNATHS